MRKTLSIGCGISDKEYTDRLDWKSYGQKDIHIFDLNSGKPLPYKNNTFIKIKINYVIQHLIYTQEVLEECYRILKKDGYLELTFPDYESLFYFLFPIRDKIPKGSHLNNGHTYGIWNENMMRNRLKLVGFKEIKTSKYGRGPTNLWLSNPAIKMVARK